MNSPALSALPREPIAGQYRVDGVLGEGGMGIVYDAVRLSDGTPVALKVIHSHLAGDKQVRARFEREALILRRLEGPNICPIFELGEVSSEGGQAMLYMVLPKLAGPTLEQALRSSLPLDVDRALDIMLEICAALRTAHMQGVIHRDLKPANVILESGRRAVVVDFGMSKIIHGAASGMTNLTAHNMIFGTPEYMSPEQARGDELDVRCDVYAAGVMLYEMLTGGPPFTGKAPLHILTEHLTGELTPPSERAAGRVTPALEAVVLHALARDRDERYPSASALAAAIVHARAAPHDTHSLRPGAFGTSPEGTDAFALTMPEIAPSDAPPKLAEDVEDNRVPSDTLLASVPPVPMSPSLVSVVPRTPSRTAAPAHRPLPEGSTRLWVILWVLALTASVAAGVYFALR